MKILVVGDVHADWKTLHSLIYKEKPSLILQAGDMGYWPSHYPINFKTEIPIYFCPGNHEDWNALDQLASNEVAPNIFYMKKGSTLTLKDGRRVLFMGGALSIDKALRIPGYSWFPQEMITERDLVNLPEGDIDIVISHTCPQEFKVQGTLNIPDQYDSSRDCLSYILQAYKPKQWFFGHWHLYKQGIYDQCEWTCLNTSREEGWYTIL